MKFAALCGLVVITMAAPILRQTSALALAAARAQQPAEAPFAAEIAAFEAADSKNPPPTGAVLFLGSSSIRLWTTLQQDFPELPVINRGFGGSQIADSVRYADRIVFPCKPRMIVFYAGTNDLNAGKSPAQVFQDFQAFAEKVHAALPNTRLVYISINPSVARWNQEAKTLETNGLIERYIRQDASRPRFLTYINSHTRLLKAGRPQPGLLRADGLHLNAAGYKTWLTIVKPRLLAVWKAMPK